MILDDIATHLAANSTRLTVGTNLTKGYMPASPATCTTIFETGGLAPIKAFSTGTVDRVWEQPSIMVHSRSTDYQTARNTIEDVFTILDGIGNTTLSGTRYGRIDAIQSPIDIGQDSNDRHMLSVNFNVMKSTG